MADDKLLKLCSSVLEPIQTEIGLIQRHFEDEIRKIPDKINLILQDILKEVKKEFQDELAQRDLKIKELEDKVILLEKTVIPPKDPVTLVDLPGWRNCTPFKDVSAENKSGCDVFLLGDSIVKHIDGARLTRSSNNVVDYHTGHNVMQIRNKFVEIDAKYRVKNLILHAGTNDIPRDEPNMVSSKILRLVKDVKERMPETRVFVSAILPKYSPEFNDGINQINFSLYTASLSQGFSFIQHNQFCSNGIFCNELYSRREVEEKRPVHLNRRGQAAFAVNIKSALRSPVAGI